MKDVHRFLLALTSLTFVCSIFAFQPALSAGGPLEDEISASQRGEYTRTINIGQKLIESYPNSDLAHYYLADAYYHTNQLRQAEEEYRQCLRVTQNKTLQTYCQDFLSRVKNISLQDITPPNSISVKMDEVSKLHEQMHEEEARQASEEQSAIARLNRDADAKLKAIQDQLTRDLADAPTDTSIEPSIGRRNNVYDNYVRQNQSQITHLNNEAYRATTMIQRQLAIDIAKVKNSYAQHDKAVAEFSHGITSQLKPGISDVQLTPHNLGLNVKNYENFAPSNPVGVAAPPAVELRATPELLHMPPSARYRNIPPQSQPANNE
jgi:tetratricopeptide (TPR) repeat protein